MNKLIIIILIFVNSVISQYTANFGQCRSPLNYQGICLYLAECPSIYKLLVRDSLKEADLVYLRESQCGFYNGQPLVCCTDYTFGQNTVTQRQQYDYSYLLPKPGTCGNVNHDRIYGGEKTSLTEFPWMALLEYSKPNSRKGFHCGGVLITEQYVLTAAHCVNGKDIKSLNWDLTSVRLGEWDLNSERDCDKKYQIDCEDEDFSDPPLNVEVEELIPHEDYNPYLKTQENDIALVRLKQKVTFTEFIQPICIPITDKVKQKNLTGIKMQVAGWGRTENSSSSNFKLKANINGVSAAQCNNVYNRLNLNLIDGQLCAGGQFGIDSCRGDSGGPLMLVDLNENNLPYYYCVGIVSFGPTPCGMEGWPGVYTKVSQYSDWIVSNLRP